MVKRARQSATTLEVKTSKRRKTLQLTTTTKIEAPFRFLELPPEIREHIYVYVAEETPAYLQRRSRGELNSKASIRLVNKHLHQEFKAALYQHAPKITAHALDFDFRHIVTFFNHLNELELETLPDATKPASHDGEEREMTIQLDFTPRCPSTPYDLPYLVRWLKRCRHPTKKGNNVRLQYVAEEAARSNRKTQRDWFWYWRSVHRNTQDPELEKIMLVVNGGRWY